MVLVIILTAVILSSVLLVRAYQDSRQDLIDNTLNLGKVLARTLRPALTRDEVWQAYETIMTPLERSLADDGHERLIMVLDRSGSIFVSSQPSAHPMLTPLEELGESYSRLQALIGTRQGDSPYLAEGVDPARFVMVVPILAEDGSPMGTLILSYARALLLPRFLDTVERVILATLFVLAVLLPLGWFWGKRMTDPMVKLSTCMARVGSEPPDDIQCDLYDGGDEIGLLSARFRRMLEDLREKEQLERGVMASERLAAVGRLTAGIAHEINNPLGGMLNALSTHRRHGTPDAITARTLSLLERGLLQIKETVGALLVETRLESHALTPQDIHDIHTLILPDVHAKSLELDWAVRLVEPVALPSTQVRQIMLNLLLNALQASHPGGRVSCDLGVTRQGLCVEVINHGDPIPAEKMAHLFEPFSGSSGRGHGLGLWVTYQLVQQMDGRIEVESSEHRTLFRVVLPLRDREAA
ncbi:sensor histidine kinase [Thioalkalivibrio sulfidiphilus]|uniref:sensor histidine kinase n=1 Tax=Thioalkalivibrio sulfidiphilus TaxID=1033854 RepID=UPI001E566753|nr:sensor histidine kinase [Thioalkalivibrio sulfidiphilus]